MSTEECLREWKQRAEQEGARADAAEATVARVKALVDAWSGVPPYRASDYDRGRVDQRQMCEEEVRAALADPLPDPRRLNLAKAFIRARFFPPLPADVYGPALLDAIDALSDDDPERWVALPAGTEPLPRDYRDRDGGGYEIPAHVLYGILHADRFEGEWLSL